MVEVRRFEMPLADPDYVRHNRARSYPAEWVAGGFPPPAGCWSPPSAGFIFLKTLLEFESINTPRESQLDKKNVCLANMLPMETY